MPALRTEITEIVTGLAMFGYSDLEHALGVEPAALANVDAAAYARLRDAFNDGGHGALFATAWRNGSIFARSVEGLRGRPPWLVEWKGGHRPPGYEQIPADLRVDHVYLISCKYGSNILTNSSPGNLFDGLLGDRQERRVDWYLEVAAEAYQEFYREAVAALGVRGLPAGVADLDPSHREILKRGLPRRLEGRLASVYSEFASTVAVASADRWRAALSTAFARESMVWRLLRLQAAPYFVLGESADGTPLRYRVSTPWDFRNRYKFNSFEVAPEAARRQPVVGWSAAATDRHTGRRHTVYGHVEVRWSHGRFAQVPEAKVYLGSPHHLVPGYVQLDDRESNSEPRLAFPG